VVQSSFTPWIRAGTCFVALNGGVTRYPCWVTLGGGAPNIHKTALAEFVCCRSRIEPGFTHIRSTSTTQWVGNVACTGAVQ
jgi:hypothetical protein